MSQVNPFQSPQIHPAAPVVQAQMVATAAPVGVWQDRGVLVMHKSAMLPDVCVKSNQPCNGRRLKRNMYWHHPAIYLTILAGILIYAILAMVLRKQAIVWVPLTDEWWSRRRRAIGIGWGAAALGLAMCIGGPMLASETRIDALALGIPLGIVVIVAGAIFGASRARMVSAKKIDDTYVWLNGVHRDYVAALPPFPWAPQAR